MNYNKISNRELIIILFIVFAAIIRLIPHPPNFAPITAMALFGGVYFKNRKQNIKVRTYGRGVKFILAEN